MRLKSEAYKERYFLVFQNIFLISLIRESVVRIKAILLHVGDIKRLLAEEFWEHENNSKVMVPVNPSDFTITAIAAK